MKHRLYRAFTALPVAALLAVLQPSTPPITVNALDYAHMNTIQRHLLSGTAAMELTDQNASSEKPDNYFPRGSDSCPVNISSNIKVNQNCLNLTDPDLQGRAQANNETSIAQDPMDPNHIVATSNDYRRGDGNCFNEYSLDKGRTWNDAVIPSGFSRGRTTFGASRQYWEGQGDPSVAWDTRGNVYFSCQQFQRGFPVASSVDLSSAVYVYRSTQNFGASWNFPGRPVIESGDVTGSGTSPFEDKPYLTVDNHVGSPFRDRIYVTYTEFSADGSAVLWESYSADYGEHFSARHLVSVNSPLCTNTFGFGTPEGNCNENQFTEPFTGPDGSLYVVFDNYNNTTKAADNRNQVFIVKSTDGGNTFSAPIKVSDYYDLPDCLTYTGHNPGFGCLPEKAATNNSHFRGNNYPSASVNPLNPNQIVVNFGSYINQHSNEANGCVPAGVNPATGGNLFTGVKTPGSCNNDILISVSNDGGLTFTGTATDPRTEAVVTTDAGQATTDQWWQWTAFNKSGKLAVSYYDRQYGSDETTGFSDVSLSGTGDLANFVILRVTSSSMPPPTQFNGDFLGDYSGLTAVDNAYPLWSDTRSPDLFLCPNTGAPGVPPAVCGGTSSSGLTLNDEDIYTAALSVPSK